MCDFFGVYYYWKGDLVLALENYYFCISNYKNMNTHIHIYYNMAEIYSIMEFYDLYALYLQQTYKLSKYYKKIRNKYWTKIIQNWIRNQHVTKWIEELSLICDEYVIGNVMKELENVEEIIAIVKTCFRIPKF